MGRGDQRLTQFLRLPPERLNAGRRRALLEAATPSSGFAQVKSRAWPIAQTAAAAAVAWLVAETLLGHASPFFAPVGAIMALGATRGQRSRRAVEMMLGVTLGIGLGDLLVQGIGTGVLQLALVVALAMGAAVLLGAGRVLLTEAAVSGALVVTLAPESYGFPPTRLIDVFCGGAVALVFSQVLFPVHPLRVVRDAATSVLDELAATLRDVAAALELRDLEAAERALARARDVSAYWSTFEQALDVSREAVRYSPRRRRFRAEVADYRDAGLPIDLLVTDLRVLARTAVRALLIGDPVPPDIADTLRDLATVAHRLSACVGRAEASTGLRGDALGAARRATQIAHDETNMSINVLAAYAQATAADIIRTLGVPREPAHEMVGRAARGAEPWQAVEY